MQALRDAHLNAMQASVARICVLCRYSVTPFFPTPEWGGGGMVGGTGAAALRLPLAPSVTGTSHGAPPLAPPPPRRGSVHGSSRQRMPPNQGAMDVGCAVPGGNGKPTPADAGAQVRKSTRPGAPSRPPGTLRAAPRAGYGGGGGGPSTGGLPLGVGSGSGPSMRQEGVYTPTAQEGAPGRGDGLESHPGGGNSPRRWQGAPRRSDAVAVW